MKRILWIWCMLLLAVPAGAAVRRNVLSNDNGLSNSSVTCICQDSSGMLWLGTWDGLNRYDGSEFRVYKFEPDNPNTISNNVIRRIVEERAGVLWIATDYGINRLDVRSGRIDRFYPGYEKSSPVGEQAFCVAAAPDGEVFCASAGWGIARYDRDAGQFVALNLPHFNSTEVRMLCAPDAEHLLLLMTSGRLVQARCAPSASGHAEIAETAELLPGRRVAALFETSRRIYIADGDAVLHLYDRAAGCITGEIPLPLPSKERLCALAEYPDGRLVCAFQNSDTRIYDPAAGTFAPLEELSGVPVLSLLYGSQNILWAGSDGRGVLNLYEDDIEFNRTENSRMFGEKSAPVRSFFENDRGDLYVATKGNGIYVLRADGSSGGTYDRTNGLGNASVYALAAGYGDVVRNGASDDARTAAGEPFRLGLCDPARHGERPAVARHERLRLGWPAPPRDGRRPLRDSRTADLRQ